MPRERVQHGKLLIVTVDPDDTDTDNRHGPGATIMREYDPGEPMPEGTVLREQPSLDVMWNREGGWVQLQIEAPRTWWDAWYASYAGSPEQHHFPVVTEVLTRREINAMIRTLRRARDAAYEADE